jgi:hypothetical protein
VKVSKEYLKKLILEQVRKIKLPADTIRTDIEAIRPAGESLVPPLDIERESYWRNFDVFQDSEIEEIMSQIQELRTNLNVAARMERWLGRKFREAKAQTALVGVDQPTPPEPE